MSEHEQPDEQPDEQPAGTPVGELELEPLEAHVVALRAELARTRTVLLCTAGACALAALLVLYAARSQVTP